MVLTFSNTLSYSLIMTSKKVCKSTQRACGNTTINNLLFGDNDIKIKDSENVEPIANKTLFGDNDIKIKDSENVEPIANKTLLLELDDTHSDIKVSENVEPDPIPQMVNPIPSNTILEDDLVQPSYNSIAEDIDGIMYYVGPPAGSKGTPNLPAVAESGADLPTVAESEYSAGEPPPIR